MNLPTNPAVLVAVSHSRSGWEGYDRGIRDHLTDARPGDPYGLAYWTHRALTLARLGLAGCRYNATSEQYDRAAWTALADVATLALYRRPEDSTDEHAARGAAYGRAVVDIKRGLQRRRLTLDGCSA